MFDEHSGANGDTQRSSQSMLSIRGRSGSVVSNRSGSGVGINLPSSSHGSGFYQLPDNDPFGGSSVQRGLGAGPDIFNEEEPMVLGAEFELFEFGDDGGLRDITDAERQARRDGSLMPPPIPKPYFGSDSAASRHVRKEHEDGFAGHNVEGFDADGDFNMDFGGDDLANFPDVEAFPLPAAPAQDGIPRLNDSPSQDSEYLSSISAAAPANRKKARAKGKRKLPQDEFIEISNAELNHNNREYVDNMARQSMNKYHEKEKVQAKKNAFQWVFGSGLNGVGNGVGSSKLPTALAMFSGQALLTSLRGEQEDDAMLLKGTKRKSFDLESAEDVEAGSSPSKRIRESEIGRGNEDDMMLNIDDDRLLNDQSLEMARDAPDALADIPSSAHMPWNVSASLHSHQRGASSSIQGSRRGLLPESRRLTTASPLIGRGSALPGDLERFNQSMDENEIVMYGRSDNDDYGNGGEGGISSSPNKPLPGSSQHEDDDVFGAAAGVDTQTAGTSQWVRDALDKEGNNFFEFVRNIIEEKGEDELSQGEIRQGGEDKFVAFEELFDPEQNSAVVAAQAFYHVLSLATKRRVWVEQLSDLEVIGGEIRIGILA